MKKYKKGAGALAILAALALSAQASLASPHNQSFESAIQGATRRAFNNDRQVRDRSDRVLQMSYKATRH
jgi:hypothetical protein